LPLLAGKDRQKKEFLFSGRKYSRLDLSTVTGSALPGQVSQGAVAGSLKLSVLFTLSVLSKGRRRRQGQTHTHFGRAVWFEGVSMNLSCQSLRKREGSVGEF
jgi:hypothetical protein